MRSVFTDGPLPAHGFARTSRWTLVSNVDATAVFELRESPATLALWPHAFALRYQVTVGDASLTTRLTCVLAGRFSFLFVYMLCVYRWCRRPFKLRPPIVPHPQRTLRELLGPPRCVRYLLFK